jgi:hypothetical protein
VSRDQPPDQPPDVSAQPKHEWMRPQVQRVAAGFAEDGSGPLLDGILNPS